MTARPIKRAQWIGSLVAYHVWRWLPFGRMDSPYGRFNLWLLGYAGAYGYSDDFQDFCDHVSFK